MPVWSEQFAQNTGEIQGLSPIPFIWVIGDKGTGKSTFIATIDPVRPGEKTRTLVTDLEMSQETIKTQAPMDVVNIRVMTADKYGNKYTPKDLFVTWRDYVLGIKPGQYSNLGVDPASDIYMGCFMWIGDNPEIFGKTARNYTGEMGTKSQWGDAALYWKMIGLELASRFETTVFVSHIKDEFKNNVRTGSKVARGADFYEIATLVLWLDKTPEGKYWALVKKSRLSWWDWGKPEEGRKRPILRELLPRRLEPTYPGQSYPELIDSFMAAPKADYGELNVVENDPSEIKQSDFEKQQVDLQLKEMELKQRTDERRSELVNTLIQQGYFKSSADVVKAVRALDEQYSIDRHDALYKKLVEYAERS